MLHNRRQSAWRTRLLLLLAAVLVVSLAAGCGRSGKDGGDDLPGAGEGKTVATYDGGQVTEKEFDNYATLVGMTDPSAALYMSIPQFKEQYLRQYVIQKVFHEQATKEDKQASAENAEQFKQKLDDALKTQTDIKAEMDKAGLTSDDIHEMVEYLGAAAGVIQRKQDELTKAVTDKEIQEEYKKDPSQFNVATVRHILIMTTDRTTGEEKHSAEEALKLAKEAKAELEKTGDWDAVAKKYSEDEGSKDNGGLYEDAKVSDWVPGFKEAANTQEIGKIGDPVESQYGYHVIKVEKRTETAYDKLEQADKDQLRNAVGSAKLNEFMESEQKRINLKITLPEEPAEGADNTGTNDAAGNAGTDNTAAGTETDEGAANAGADNTAANTTK